MFILSFVKNQSAASNDVANEQTQSVGGMPMRMSKHLYRTGAIEMVLLVGELAWLWS
jgi:hypothetical protein